MKNGPAFEWVKMKMLRVFSDLSAVLCYSQVLHVVCFCLVQSTTMECMTWHELHYWHDCIVGIQTIALYLLYLFSCFSLQRFKLVIDSWIPSPTPLIEHDWTVDAGTHGCGSGAHGMPSFAWNICMDLDDLCIIYIIYDDIWYVYMFAYTLI